MSPARTTAAIRCLGQVVVVGLIAVAFLFQPMPMPRQWGPETVHVSPHLGFALNFDSPAFLELADDPSRMFADKPEWRGRQSRPLYVLLTWALARPFQHTPGLRAMYPHRAYPGSIVLNLAVLLLSLNIFVQIVAPSPHNAVFATMAGVLLFANDCAKVFVWTPHQQLFNILEPLVCVLLVVRTAERAMFSIARAATYGLGTGVLMLAYGSFALLVPAVCAGALLRWHRGREPSGARVVAMCAAAALACALAPIAWVGFVTHVTGGFHGSETAEYRQFVWMADVWHRGGASRLGLVLMNFTARYARALARGLLVPAFAAGGLILLRLAAWERTVIVARARAVTLVACAVSLVLNLVFFWLLGFYEPRLTVAVTPPLLVGVATLAAGVVEPEPAYRRRVILLVFAAAVVAAQRRVVMNAGPGW